MTDSVPAPMVQLPADKVEKLPACPKCGETDWYVHPKGYSRCRECRRRNDGSKPLEVVTDWFQEKVTARLLTEANGCWRWTGGTNKHGYGCVARDGKTLRVHRVVYEHLVGLIPAGKILDHICHNRACANPEHLRLVTVKQNNENKSGPSSNSKSGFLGVFPHRASNKWEVRVAHEGVSHYGGLHESPEAANEVAIALRNRLFTHNDQDRKGSPPDTFRTPDDEIRILR